MDAQRERPARHRCRESRKNTRRMRKGIQSEEGCGDDVESWFGWLASRDCLDRVVEGGGDDVRDVRGGDDDGIVVVSSEVMASRRRADVVEVRV